MRQGEKAESHTRPDICMDHTVTPITALGLANLLLAEHGLEFVNHETDSDYYCFSLQRIVQRKG